MNLHINHPHSDILNENHMAQKIQDILLKYQKN